MQSKQFSKGSEWRKWDLHVHTASSFDAYKGEDANALAVTSWREHKLSAVAITDHFIIDEERIKALTKLAPEITIFPGVELRTDKGGSNIHPILIFSEQIKLEELAESFRIFKREKGNATDRNETIYWDYNAILEFAKRHDAIISIHTGGKENGLDKEISNDSLFKQAIKKEYAESVHILEVNSLKDVNEYKNTVFKSIKERPLIICSDNHDPHNYKTKEYLWIKANPTFEGLKQVLIHPSERVYIGSIPQKLDKVNKKPSSYIQTIGVSRVGNPNRSNETWFDFELPLNHGLVAIIGNKGSGKSALSDIIGHLCKCRTMQDCSFLNDKRFRKSPELMAKDYTGTIVWCDNDKQELSLFDSKYDTSIENAQYLPQQFIESTCNNLDDSFQKEINDVIFSYIEKAEKHDAKSLDQLKAIISEPSILEIGVIKEAIKSKIRSLIDHEGLLESEYKTDIEDKLKKKKEELEKHKKLKPKEVNKPQNAQNVSYQQDLKLIDENISNLDREIAKCQEQLKDTNLKITKIQVLEQKLKSVDDNLKGLNLELQSFAGEYALNVDTMTITYSLPLSKLSQELNQYTNKKNELTVRLHSNNIDTNDKQSLAEQLKIEKEKKEKIVSQADATEKAFQKYLADKKEWDQDLKKLTGGKDIDNSVAYFENKIEYIEKDLKNDYGDIKKSIYDSIELLFAKKKNISDKLLELYKPVKRELTSVLGDIEEKIEFDIEISLKSEPKVFSGDILKHIYKNKSGEFYGESQSLAFVQELIEKINFGASKEVLEFIAELYEKVAKDFKVIKDKNKFYEYLFSLDYLDINFVLKLGGRPLQSLSAGEKGIVLLVFYLALNKNEMPIIIDQPEDNLDNQSVYTKLVACISRAKLRRQVIIVTHNPNIAIACDAEQIIHCSMDKNTHSIRYESGAIEKNEIKEHVVDVLEGTMPAFDLRRRKYE